MVSSDRLYLHVAAAEELYLHVAAAEEAVGRRPTGKLISERHERFHFLYANNTDFLPSFGSSNQPPPSAPQPLLLPSPHSSPHLTALPLALRSEQSACCSCPSAFDTRGTAKLHPEAMGGASRSTLAWTLFKHTSAATTKLPLLLYPRCRLISFLNPPPPPRAAQGLPRRLGEGRQKRGRQAAANGA